MISGLFNFKIEYLNSKCKSTIYDLRSTIHGFSLMEMVVSLGVFSILVVATFGMFASSLRAHQTALAQTRIEREAQLLLSVLSKKIRTSNIDYTAYGGAVSNPTNTLYLVDQADSQIVFQLNATNKTIDLVVDGGAPRPITSSDVEAIEFFVYIEPITDPFTIGSTSITTLPRVTMVLNLQSKTRTGQVQVRVQETVIQREEAY